MFPRIISQAGTLQRPFDMIKYFVDFLVDIRGNALIVADPNLSSDENGFGVCRPDDGVGETEEVGGFLASARPVPKGEAEGVEERGFLGGRHSE